MASLRARLYNQFLRLTAKPKPIFTMDHRILRAQAEARMPRKPPAGVSIHKVEDGGVRGEWHRPTGVRAQLTVLYLHGGGYVFCSPRTHRSLTCAMAREFPAELFSLDYRLAPEHPFPAAVEDARAAYEWLLDGGVDPARLAVAGDSAGGGLALALLVALRDEGRSLPSCAVLYSPWTDLAMTGASLEENDASDVLFRADGICEAPAKYLNGADPKTPLISPLYADLSGLPPLLAFASASEVLRDDSTRLVERAKSAGVDAKLVLRDGLAHVWPVFQGWFPEAREALGETASFVRKHAG
ncbi:MAG: alpha/beta hydrolase [Parvularculaceae bacterium]